MKYQKLDGSGHHERFVMHIGRDETEILVSLLANARIHAPRVEKTTSTMARVRQMEREFRKALQDDAPQHEKTA